MIVPMKKITVIVQSKDAASTIETLRSLGVLHVEHQQAPEGKDVSVLKDDIALIDETIGVLSGAEYSKRASSEITEELKDWKPTARHVIDLWKRLDQLEEYSRTLKNIISKWESWGEFDPETIRALSEKNIYIRLYEIPVKDIKKLPPELIVKRLRTVKGIANCAVISRKKVDIPFKELTLPKTNLKKVRERLSKDNQAMELIKGNIHIHTCYRENLISIKKTLKKELEFHEALKGMGQSGSLMYVTGYIPYDSVEQLLETSKKEKWGVVTSDPSEEDKVPTLIRNPRWVSIIAPIFKVIEIIPGYRELDISLWFLIFFSIFFGMLIGDAAYGVIFFILTLFAQRKWGRKLRSKSVFILFYILSSCAIIWGALTGTFFGQEWLPQSVKPLVPALRDSKDIQAFCFLLGAIHLSIAHLWRTIVKLPSARALSDIGWTLILWGAFFLAKMLILGYTFPPFGKWLFIAGVFLVIFFTNPSRNVLKGIGTGLGNLFLNFVSSFTDIVSYIRLFAVGLATVAIADAFNRMAMSIGYNSILTGAATSLILLLGHALNVILGPLAILVHGVRLNVLEFCNHVDVKWSGFSYKPLQK